MTRYLDQSYLNTIGAADRRIHALAMSALGIVILHVRKATRRPMSDGAVLRATPRLRELVKFAIDMDVDAPDIAALVAGQYIAELQAAK